jgi:hypothetical protein
MISLHKVHSKNLLYVAMVCVDDSLFGSSMSGAEKGFRWHDGRSLEGAFPVITVSGIEKILRLIVFCTPSLLSYISSQRTYSLGAVTPAYKLAEGRVGGG